MDIESIFQIPPDDPKLQRAITNDLLLTMKQLRRFEAYVDANFNLTLPESAGTFYCPEAGIDLHDHYSFCNTLFAIPLNEADAFFQYITEQAHEVCEEGLWRECGETRKKIHETKMTQKVIWHVGTHIITLTGSRDPSGRHKDDRATWLVDPLTGWVKFHYVDWEASDD